MWVVIKCIGWKFRIGIVYGLQESRADDEKIDNWFYELEEHYARDAEEPTLIIGDFNAHIGDKSDGITGNLSKVNKNGDRLKF